MFQIPQIDVAQYLLIIALQLVQHVFQYQLDSTVCAQMIGGELIMEQHLPAGR